MATQVYIVERDAALRETVALVLEEAGYAVDGVGDVHQALAALRASPHPMVVLIGHGDPETEGLSLLEQSSSLPPHAYLLLSTHPQAAPSVSNPYTQHLVPIMAEPFDVVTLLAQVNEAAHRLDAAHASGKDGDAPS